MARKKKSPVGTLIAIGVLAALAATGNLKSKRELIREALKPDVRPERVVLRQPPVRTHVQPGLRPIDRSAIRQRTRGAARLAAQGR